jgi:hypothetical protein
MFEQLGKLFGRGKIFILFLFILSPLIFAQQTSNSVSSVSFGKLKDKHPADVKVTLINPSSVARVQLVYKSFNETDYRIKEMEIMGNTATYKISGEDISAPTLTYYLIIELKNGTRETYPMGVPAVARPIDLTVATPSKKDKEILILSPADNETISLDDLFISISLVNTPDDVDISKTKIFLNGTDITSKIMFAGDLLLYYPQNYGDEIKGNQTLRIDVYKKDGSLYHSVERSFSVVSAAEAVRMESKFKYYGNVIAEIRNEAFENGSNLYSNLGLRVNGGIDNWKFNAYGYITSEENGNIQPQNRYYVSVANNWLYLRGGDSYPRYNNLLLNGKRLRGVDGKLDLWYFHLQGSYGEVRREVEGKLLQTFPTSAEAPLESNVIRIDSVKYGAPFGKVDFGIQSRKLLSGRIGIGSEEGFEFGLSFLHAIDDVNSIEFGVKPQENLVASTDIGLVLDNRRIIVKGVAAVSLVNSDITSGTYSDEQIDSIFAYSDELGSDAEAFKDIKNKLSPFFTINQFIEPINFTELSSLAAESSVELSYFHNNLKGAYIYRGNQFKSFGQEYTRTDVAGLNITDRFRTLDNQLFFTVGYENLHDNLQETKAATTTFQTIRASVSLFMRIDMPNITLSYINNKNYNDFSPQDSLNKFYFIDDITNRYSLNLGYDFNWKVKHNASLGFVSSNREDNSIYNYNTKYFSTSFTLNSYWTRALTTNFGVTYYDSDIDFDLYKYVTLSLGGRYFMLNNNLELSLNYSPSFGDFNRHAIDLIAAYQIVQNFWVRGQMRYYTMPDTGTNTIAGLTVTYNF